MPLGTLPLGITVIQGSGFVTQTLMMDRNECIAKSQFRAENNRPIWDDGWHWLVHEERKAVWLECRQALQTAV
jgi:hypothetical protein